MLYLSAVNPLENQEVVLLQVKDDYKPFFKQFETDVELNNKELRMALDKLNKYCFEEGCYDDCERINVVFFMLDIKELYFIIL